MAKILKRFSIASTIADPIFAVTNCENENRAKPNQQNEGADFETAISATGFGKYNILLIVIALPAACASVFETTTMSYVFPAAQCDLNLSLEDKGGLNAITYLGMVSSALIWGFLYDTLGRKKLLMAGYFLDFIFVLMSSFSQTKTMLMVFKFLGGMIINGPFAALTSYISEFQSAENRARMQLVLGTTYSLGSIILPLIAWLIMPQNYSFTLFNTYQLHSWGIFLMICGIPSLLSTVIFMVMPESPKFLMTMGQNDKALRVFQKVYSINSGKPMESYPIKVLVDEIEMKRERDVENKHSGQVTANRSKAQAMKEGWNQMKPLFFRPHLVNLMLVCSICMLFTMSLNTLRLWLPQIFQAMNDYQFYHNGSSAGLCEMLELIQPSNITNKCEVNLDNSSVYINSIVVCGVSMISYLFAGALINYLGKKILLGILAVMSSCCVLSIYFATNSTLVLTFSSLFNATSSVAANVVLAVIIDLFPTTLRTMTVAIAMMLARGGAMAGNLVFPIFLQLGCGIPFITMASILFGCVFLTFFIPNTDRKALE